MDLTRPQSYEHFNSLYLQACEACEACKVACGHMRSQIQTADACQLNTTLVTTCDL